MNDIGGFISGHMGNLLGIAGLLTGFIFFWLSRRPKRFGWQLISSTEIVSFKGRSLAPLKVVYDGSDVYSPNMIVLRVGNAGKAEIKPEDYDGPVRVEFTKGRLLSADVSKTFDPRIGVDLVRDTPMSVTFTPSLLNSGEWADLQFITDGPTETPKVSARVAGETRAADDVLAQQKRLWLPIVWVGTLACLAFPPINWIFLDDALADVSTAFIVAGVFLFQYGMHRANKSPAWRRNKTKKKPRVGRRASERPAPPLQELPENATR